jgi:hypothetical protein
MLHVSAAFQLPCVFLAATHFEASLDVKLWALIVFATTVLADGPT